MRKLMAVAALGMMLAVVGCDKNKEKDTSMTTTTSTSSDPKKMSLSEKPSASSSCNECNGAAKSAK
jgi:hypothetical protein